MLSLKEFPIVLPAHPNESLPPWIHWSCDHCCFHSSKYDLELKYTNLQLLIINVSKNMFLNVHMFAIEKNKS